MRPDLRKLESSKPSSKQNWNETHRTTKIIYRRKGLCRLTDNITITPGLVAVFNPGHNAANDTVLIGAIRTTFSF